MIHDAVVTGVGCLLARAPGAAALRPGAAAAPPATRLPEPLPRPARWGCPAPRLARMDRFSQVTFLAAHEAFLAAALDARPPRREGFALCLGTAYGCHAVNEAYYRGFLRDGARGASPRLFAATLPSSPLGELAIGLGAQGPALTLTEGWHAGLGAIAEAARLCARGQAEVVLAGGSDVLSATLERLLADWGFAGLDLAEGAAFVVVEQAAAARARGATPLAAICGAGAAFAPTPAHGPALALATAAALREAGLAPAALGRRLVSRAPVTPPPDGAAARDDDPAAVDPAGRFGVTLGAGGALGVALALQEEVRVPTLVAATDPLGGAAALVLGPPPGVA
jgi:3-oxoacyl-[acyl-carrier-protein] synthase II